MQCLKCGNEFDGDKSFCAACLSSMEAYPVKPGTPVTLPKRQKRVPRSSLPRQPKSEEIIEQLQRQVSRLRRWIAVLAVLLATCVGLGVYQYLNQEETPVKGSNYSSIDETTLPPTDTSPIETTGP